MPRWPSMEDRQERKSLCHPDRRHRAHGMCNQCYLSKYRDDHKGRIAAVVEKRRLERKYGISPEAHEEMLRSQGGLCALCMKPPAEGKKLHIDHCHETGVVRGLLCHICNWYLGKIDSDPDIIKRIESYRKRQ